VVDGLENAREALNALFSGESRGKLVIKVADPEEL
jgi:NADPH-dependent curcumin reductase CurA